MSQRPGLPHGVVLVLALAVLLNYVDRANLAIAAPLLQDELSLSNSEVGLLLSAFFWVYAPAQLLAGWLVHRFDTRIVMAAGVGLWAAATAVTGLAGGFAAILFWRLMLGLGESVTFPSWQLIVARHTAEHERGRVNGFIGAGQGVGPMLGTLFGGLAMAYFGWRAMFIGLGIITFAWIWPWFVVTRGRDFNAPDDHALPMVSYLAILRQREFWGAALGHFSINYTFYFVMTWLPSFLVKAGGFTVSEMAAIGATIFGVYAVSTALAGAASDRWIHRGGSATLVRKTFALTSAFGAALRLRAAPLWSPAPQCGCWVRQAVLRPFNADDVRDDRDACRSARRGPVGGCAKRGRPAGGNPRPDRDRHHHRSHRQLLTGICCFRSDGAARGGGVGRCDSASGGGAVVGGVSTSCGIQARRRNNVVRPLGSPGR